MILQQFLGRICCKVTIQNQGNVNLVITTEAIRRVDNRVIDRVRTTIDIQETNEWVMDSNTPISITPWSWNDIIDETKRAHLDYFAQRAPIDNWFPLNKTDNPDISHLYC